MSESASRIETSEDTLNEFRRTVLAPLDLDKVHESILAEIISCISLNYPDQVSPLTKAQKQDPNGCIEWIYLNYNIIKPTLDSIKIYFKELP